MPIVQDNDRLKRILKRMLQDASRGTLCEARMKIDRTMIEIGVDRLSLFLNIPLSEDDIAEIVYDGIMLPD